MQPVEVSINLDKLKLSLGELTFLDLRSEGLSNLATLSEPRFVRSDNRSALLDISPSSLRSRKEKSNLGKISSSSFVFLYRPYYVTRKEDIFSLKEKIFSLSKEKMKPTKYYFFVVCSKRVFF